MFTACATAADPAVLMERDRAFDKATAERGAAGLSDFVAEDIALFPNGQDIQHGRETMKTNWADLLAKPGSIRWHPVEGHIAASGDLGWTAGVAEIHMTDDKGQKVDWYGKYLTVWRKDPDGVWRASADLGSSRPAPK